MRALVALVASLLLATTCQAAEFKYALYARQGKERVLLAKGTKSYAPSDFVTRREERSDRFYGVRKQLELAEGYSVGVLDTLESTTGFGLTVGRLPFDRSPNDFSWEWYTPESPGVFRKLQGGSRVEVEFFGLPSTSELRSVTFVDDAEFEYVEDLCCKPEDDGPTHILEISAGSVLLFPVDGT